MGYKEAKKDKLNTKKFKVQLVKNFVFVTTKVKGKEVKCSPNKKIFYPFEK